jgi:hypothetical protein
MRKLARETFLELLRRFTREQRPPTKSKASAYTYAPREFAKEPEAVDAGITEVMFAEAMAALFADGMIDMGTHKTGQRKAVDCIVEVEKGKGKYSGLFS